MDRDLEVESVSAPTSSPGDVHPVGPSIDLSKIHVNIPASDIRSPSLRASPLLSASPSSTPFQRRGIPSVDPSSTKLHDHPHNDHPPSSRGSEVTSEGVPAIGALTGVTTCDLCERPTNHVATNDGLLKNWNTHVGVTRLCLNCSKRKYNIPFGVPSSRATIEVEPHGVTWNFWRITGLEVADLFATYALWILPTFLVQELHYTQQNAALLMNGFWCVVHFIPMIILFISDSLIGYDIMAIFTVFCYWTGLGILGVLVHLRSQLWWLSLLLLSIGVGGHKTISHRSLLTANNNRPSTVEAWLAAALFGLVHISGVIGIRSYLHGWELRYYIPAMIMFCAQLFFFTGIESFQTNRSTISPISVIYRVCITAFRKRSHTITRDITHYYDRRDEPSVTSTALLRCLDKAAIALEGRAEKKICTIHDVERVKRMLFLAPLYLNICLLGVISTVGETYFFEEANAMRKFIQKDPIHILVLLPLIYLGTRYLAGLLYCRLRKKNKDHRAVALQGISLATMFTPIACIAAFITEGIRLRAMRHHFRHHSLVPLFIQYILLGISDGLFEENVDKFFENETSLSTGRYLKHFCVFVFRLGSLISYSFSNISTNETVNIIVAWRTEPEGYDIDRNRLDFHMMFLMLLGFINCVNSWIAWVMFHLVIKVR